MKKIITIGSPLWLKRKKGSGPPVGSRDFNGATDRIDWAAIANLTGHALTISVWIYSDGWVTPADYILTIHQSGDAAYGIIFNIYGNNSVSFSRAGTVTMQRTSSAISPILTGGWRHLLVTHDGVITTANTVHIYVGGVELSSYDTTTNGSGEIAPTGSWSIGGRIFDDDRNFDGKLAIVRVFNRVLTASEIAKEALGDVSTTSGLLFWFKGNTADLHEAVGNVLGVADGTTEITGAGNGPTIYYP